MSSNVDELTAASEPAPAVASQQKFNLGTFVRRNGTQLGIIGVFLLPRIRIIAFPHYETLV